MRTVAGYIIKVAKSGYEQGFIRQAILNENGGVQWANDAHAVPFYLTPTQAEAREAALQRLALDWIGDLGRSIDDNEISEAGLTRLKCAAELRALLTKGEANHG